MADDVESQIDQMMQSQPAAEPQASPIEQSIDQAMQQEQLHGQYAQNPNQIARAAGEQFERAATFGLSDVYKRMTGLPPEELRARKEMFSKENPNLSTAISVAGGALPLIATGGAAGPAEAVTGSVGIGSAALAGGIEGAAFGAGSAVSDAALGDPNLNAQKVLTDIGLGSVLGIGAGALFHGAQDMFGKFGSPKGSVADVIDSEGNAAANSAENADNLINNGQTSMIKNAPDIIKAGQDLGIEPTNAMLSSDEGKLVATDMLLKGPPTAPAIRQKKIYADMYNKIGSGLQEMAPDLGMSENEVGHALQESLASNISEEAAPYEQAYGQIKQITQDIPLARKDLANAAEDILNLEPVRIDVKAPYSRLARDVAKEIQSPIFENVDQLRAYQSRLNQRLGAMTSPQDKRVVGMIVDRLDQLERATIKNEAQGFSAVPQVKEALDKIDAADKQYGPFRQKINGLMDWLGKKKVSGPKDATSFIRNELEPEDVVRNLWSKKYAGLPQYMQKNFPTEATMIKQFQKSQMLKNSMKDGLFDVNKFLKQVNVLTKEQKEFLFFPDEIKRIEASTKMMSRFPKAFNYSNTAHANAWRAFFHNEQGHLNLNPSELIGNLVQNVDDLRTERYVNRSIGMKNATNRVDEKIQQNINSILGTHEE